jgi:signal transduction histidine kinase
MRYSLAMLVAVFGLVVMTCAQTGQYSIRHITSENGLPQNSVTQITVDKHGFVWLLTQGGLARFDGEHFRIFNSGNTHGLVLERNAVLTVLPDSTVVVRPNFLPCNLVKVQDDYSVVMDSTLSTSGILIQTNCPPFNYKPLLESRGSLPDPPRMDLLDSLGAARDYVFVDQYRAYAIIGTHLVYMDTKSRDFHWVGEVPARVDAREPGYRVALVNRILLVVRGGKLTAFRDGHPLKDPPMSDQAGRILTDPGLKVFPNSDVEKAIVGTGTEAYLLRSVDGRITAEFLFEQKEYPDIATVFLEGSTQTLFIGTYTEGLYVLKKKQFRFINPADMSVESPAVYAHVATADGRIISQRYQYDPGTGRITRNKMDFGWNAILRARDKSIWFCNDHHFMHADSNFTHFTAVDSLPGQMLAIAEDEGGNIWMSAMTGNYQFYVFSPGGILRQLDYPIVTPVHTRISFIFDLDRSTLLLGTETGLYVYNKLTHFASQQRYLPGADVRTVYRGRDGGVWIGTYGSGFYRLLDGRLIQLPYDNRKYLRSAHCFFEDNNGVFWITSNNGLFSIKKAFLDQYLADSSTEVKYSFYDKDDGLSINEFDGGCTPCLVYSRQTLYLPTLKGTVFFEPDSIKAPANKNNLFVDAVSVNREPVSDFRDLHLAPGFKYVNFSLSTPFFGNRNNLYVDYMLEGFDNVWRPLGVDGLISFTTLPPGKYSLSLRKYTGDEKEEYLYTRFNFVVEPFFYQTNGFFSLLVAMAAAIFVLIFWFIDLRNRRRRKMLEASVTERTKELNQTVIRLEETLNELYQSEQYLHSSNSGKEKAISIILHDIKSPLQYAVSYSEEFARSVQELTAEDMKKFAERMNDSSKQMLGLTNELVQWLIHDKQSYNVEVTSFDLHELLVETCDLYSFIVTRNENQLSVGSAPGSYYITSDKNALKFIVRNLIDNANKNTRGGKIEMAVRDAGGQRIEILVSDTGEPMTPEKIGEVLSMRGAGYRLESGGLGFAVINDFIAMLKGEIQIENNPNRGVTIRIRLPEDIYAI